MGKERLLEPIHENIRKLRLQKGLTQSELAIMVGYSDKSMIAKIESGKATPSFDRIQRFADILEVEPNALIGFKKLPDNPPIVPLFHEPIEIAVRIPVVGRVLVIWDNLLAEENIQGFFPVPHWLKADFAVDVKDYDRPDTGVQSGSLAFIRKSPVNDGEVCAILHHDFIEVGRIYRNDDSIVLQNEYADIPPRVFTGEKMRQVQVLGKVTYVLAKLK